MPKPVCFAFATVTQLFATAAFAQAPHLEGEWVAGPPVSAGISSSVGWEKAEQLEGRPVSIVGGQLDLPDGVSCLIGAPSNEVWRDDMEHFGSGGGNWSDLGLTPVGRDEYPIETRDLDCGADGPYTLIVQTSPFILLLEYDGRVFVPLIKPVSS